MPTRLLAIARNTFLESIRQPIYFLLLLLCGICMVFLTWSTAYSMADSSAAEVSGDTKFLFELGLGTVFIFGTLLAAFIATAVVTKEIERKTILTVISKPASRVTVIVGKYLGVSVAMTVAVLCMTLFLLFSIEHGVMSNASDQVNVAVIGSIAISMGIAVLLAGAANYLYGWPFSQTAILVMTPALVIAYLIFVSAGWGEKPGSTHDEHAAEQFLGLDLKTQVLRASVGLLIANLVMTSVAIMFSTRFNQVLTIAFSTGFLVLGLLTNTLVGKYAWSNEPIGVVDEVTFEHPAYRDMSDQGDLCEVTLIALPSLGLSVGGPVYYGPVPNGAFLSVSPADERIVPGQQPTIESGLVVREAIGERFKAENVGGHGVARAPRKGDYVFRQATQVRPVVAILWLALPNLNYFWLLDAVSMAVPIPVSHLGLICAYGLCQVVFFLGVAVVLFQKRDIG